MFCPKCNKKISDKIPRCPFCGAIVNGSGVAAAPLAQKIKKASSVEPKKEPAPVPADTKEQNIKPAAPQPTKNEQKEPGEKAAAKAENIENKATAPEPAAASVKISDEIHEPIVVPNTSGSVHFSEEDEEEVETAAPAPSRKKTVPEEMPPMDVAKGYVTDEEVPAGDGKNEGNMDGGEYDYNYDGYYDDVLPVIAKEINKLPVENVLRIVFTVLAIVGIAVMLVFVI